MSKQVFLYVEQLGQEVKLQLKLKPCRNEEWSIDGKQRWERKHLERLAVACSCWRKIRAASPSPLAILAILLLLPFPILDSAPHSCSEHLKLRGIPHWVFLIRWRCFSTTGPSYFPLHPPLQVAMSTTSGACMLHCQHLSIWCHIKQLPKCLSSFLSRLQSLV